MDEKELKLIVRKRAALKTKITKAFGNFQDLSSTEVNCDTLVSFVNDNLVNISRLYTSPQTKTSQYESRSAPVRG